jgi:hypothetical protein
VSWLEAAGGRAQPWKGDSITTFPATILEEFEVCGETHGFAAPVAQAEQRAETEATETGGGASFWAG